MKKLVGAAVAVVFLVVIVFMLDRFFQIETQVQDSTGHCYSPAGALVAHLELGDGPTGGGIPGRFCYEVNIRHPQV